VFWPVHIDADDCQLRDSLGKLQLNDAALS
jgi:translation elongation factor EF-4